MNQAVYAELMRLFPFLERLTPSQLEVIQQARVMSFSAGSQVFGVGDRCESFLMLLTGAVRVCQRSEEGREIVLYRVQPGDCCILTTSCLLSGDAYPAVARMESDSTAAALSGDAFQKLLGESISFRQHVFELVGARMTHLMTLVEDVAFRKLDQRLARRLAEGAPLLRMTHQQLADELGSVREIISRLLKDFESCGLIRLSRGAVTVLDESALHERAGMVELS